MCPEVCPPGLCDGPLKVYYASYDPEPSQSRIRAEFRIVNEGPDPVPLAELQLRYYFTLEVGVVPEFVCTAVPSAVPPASCDNVTGRIDALTPRASNATHALTMGFSSGAGVLEGFGDTGGFRVAIARASGGADFNQSNDWSFDGQNVELHLWPCVTLDRKDMTVFGVKPR